MDVYASPAELPELQEFLGSFRVRFRRPEGAHTLERYMRGLLTELPNKNCDTIAQGVPGTSEQHPQEFLTNMQWDEDDLNRQRVQKMTAETMLRDGSWCWLIRASPSRGRPRSEWRGSTRARLGRWVTVSWRSPVALPIPKPPGQWPWGCICRRPGRKIPSAVARPISPTAFRFKPNPRSRGWGRPRHRFSPAAGPALGTRCRLSMARSRGGRAAKRSSGG
jgi:hypothetical protein